jgi:hypothetical protein
MQPNAAEANAHRLGLDGRQALAIGGKQRELARGAAAVERLDGADPASALGVVEFAEMQELALHDATTRRAAILDDGPSAMNLAVFAANLLAQEHARIVARSAPRASR